MRHVIFTQKLRQKQNLKQAFIEFGKRSGIGDDPGGRRSKLSKFLLGKFTMPIRREGRGR
jgi:hypothetical protein